MDSPSAPPALLPSLRALPYGGSRRSLCLHSLHSTQRLQRLPSPGAGRRLVAVATVDKLSPGLPEAGRVRLKYRLACRGSYDSGNGLPGPPPPPPGEGGPSVDGWRPALRRWDVPWQWPTVSLTMVACALRYHAIQIDSSLLAGKVEQSVLEYLGYQAGEATIDETAGVLFLEQLYGSDLFFLCMDTATQLMDHLLIEKTIYQHEIYMSFLVYKCSSVTAVAIGVMFGITNTFRPFSDDIFRYDLKEPFKLQNGWLLWAGIGLFFALVSIALTGAAMSFLNGETTQRETDSLVLLLPLIGSSNISTACLLGITGVLAPILEETVFRGFLMVSLTMWFSTPVSVLITAVVFAFAHLTPGEFPQLFVLGVALGFSYSRTRNLLTPITVHAAWNSGVILLLTFLQLQGYDIKELLQAS